MADETYYSLLEVSETATAAEIKGAYLRLIREVHPDRLANAPAYWRRQAEEKSKEINEAYTVLSSREKRRLYDAQLASYRGSATSTAHTSASTSPNSTQHRSQTTSGTNQQSARRPSPTGQQYQTPSTSAPPSHSSSQYTGQSNTHRTNFFPQAFFALICILLGVGAAIDFWNATKADDEIIPFLLAAGLFYLVAYLYRRRIRQIFNAIRLTTIKQQNWAIVGIITIALFAGKMANTQRHSVTPRYQPLSTQSQLKDRSTTVPTQEPTPTTSNVQGVPASAAPGQSDIQAAQNNAPDGSYVDAIQSKVAQNWYTQEVDPRTPWGSVAKVTFAIARDGSASNFRISQSSGYPTLDRSAMRAVERVANFSPLPSSSKSPLFVEYAFTYRGGGPASGLTASAIENMTYSLRSGQYAESVRFVDGQARSDTESYAIDRDSIVLGNLNGLPMAALVIDESGGGSGTFRSLVAVWNDDGTLMNSEKKDLGDRIVVNSIVISNGIVTVDMLTQGPNDGMCCPTQRKVLRLALRGNQFVDVQTLQGIPPGLTPIETKKITQSQPFSQTDRQPSAQENAQQPIPAAAPIAGSSGIYGKATQEDAEAPWRRSLSGSWVGKYNCAQGVTGLTLTIAEAADGGLSGIFDFYPVPGGYRFPEGSYSGAVTASPDGSFEFKPQRWISQPHGFIAVALSGHYVADTQRLQGQVTGAIGCTSFDLSRQSQTRPASVTYDLSSLSASDRASIESACSGVRLVQGAAPYHRCLNTQLEELAQHPDAPDLSRLSSVDRASIESACSGVRLVQGAASYHRCLNTQLEELAQRPDAPDLSRLSSADRASIESACSGVRLVQGAASYHRCLNTQLEELAQYPDTPDLSGLSSVDRNSIESACSGARLVQGAAAYHRCLRSQLSELGAR